MHLDEWIDREKATLDRFQARYEAMADHDPRNWPMEMSPEDWDEQFSAAKAT